MAQDNIQVGVPIVGAGNNPVTYANLVDDNVSGATVSDKINEYGPYASIELAHAALSVKHLNKIGTTVGIEDASTHIVTEYWYQGGTAQGNLIKKEKDSIEADEEDLTIENNKLKLKNKSYNASVFSGKGRVYLKKNIVSNRNEIHQGMLSESNTAYIIQYDYTISNNISGKGTLSTLIGLDYYGCMPILVEANATYIATNGCTFINIQNDTIIGATLNVGQYPEQNYAIAKQVSGVGVIPDVSYTKEGATPSIAVPANSIFIFEGGSINGGTIVLNNTAIYPDYNWLERGSNLTISGNPAVGTSKFDVTLGKPLWWNGSIWSEAVTKDQLYVVVNSLPTASVDTLNKIYLIPAETTEVDNIRDEYITIATINQGVTTYSWEKIGSTAIDLSDYCKEEDVESIVNTALGDYVSFDDLDDPEFVDEIVAISWSGGSLTKLTLEPNETAVLTKGVVTAIYRSGITEDVTNNATFNAENGTINGTTYTAPSTAGTDVISVSYSGKTAIATIVLSIENPHLSVQMGHGSTYGTASFTDTHEQLHNNLGVTIKIDNGDYLFVKVDKEDTVNNLYINNGPGSMYEIVLNAAQISGDYKYYQSRDMYNEAAGVPFLINYVE